MGIVRTQLEELDYTGNFLEQQVKDQEAEISRLEEQLTDAEKLVEVVVEEYRLTLEDVADGLDYRTADNKRAFQTAIDVLIEELEV